MDKQIGVWKQAVLFFIVLECNLSSFPTVSGQTSGSISVDCGSNSNYVDSVRNISWVPDDEYTTNGVNGNVPSAQTYYPDFSEFKTVRYFPDSLAKNCYRFAAMPSMTYMIRGTFFYGSYDNATKLPSFQMAIDGTVVANVTFDDPTIFVYHEIIFMTQLNDVTYLCLLRDSSNSVPFISAISFWSLPAGLWNANVAAVLGEGVYLKTKYRLNFGGNDLVRHPNDAFDRYWFPTAYNSTFLQSTTPVKRLTVSSPKDVVEIVGKPPEAVMDTALTSSPNMTISFPDTYSYQYVLLFYIAELDPTANATSRQFYFFVPGDRNIHLLNPFPMFSGHYSLSLYYTLTPGSGIHMSEDKTSSSTMGPLANALELFEISTNHMAGLTNSQDALAIEEIKSQMNLTEWTGDPCLPVPHSWVTCSALGNPSPSIQAVNLSTYNLTGPISPSFGNLLDLNSLDLSGNLLSGSIPPSIWDIPNLNSLDVSNNKLSGDLIVTTSNIPCPGNLTYLNLVGNNFDGTFPSLLLKCSYRNLQGVYCDNNNFGGTLDMETLDQEYTLYSSIMLISMVNNNITGLNPNNATYSPVLLGGNPCCNNSNLELYYARLNCRYNSTSVSTPNIDHSNYKTTHKLILILSLTLSIFAFVGGIIFVAIFWKYRANSFDLQQIKKEFARQQVQPTLYSYNVLRVATKDFHHDNELGKGGFGVVYKGILADGTELAVKQLTKFQQGVDDFLNEVIVITDVRHRNLVKLKGCCVHGTQHFLVFEYVENKNLAEALWGQRTLSLDWPKRLNICVGIARGLAYLHEDSQPRIIHRDIKAANVLLDKNMNAKIADFGLARLFPNDQSHISTQIAGTMGYMSPEYATLGQLTPKADVYSFGILLLEIVSGRKNIDTTLES